MTTEMRSRIMAAARSRSHIPYQIDPPPDGVTTTDCSLLVVDSARDGGAPLPAGVRTAEQIRQATVPISFAECLPADLLFFEHTYDAAGPAGPDGRIASHIGFSLGAGSLRMFDAHDRTPPPDVAETDISTDYWQEKLFEARRLPQLVGVQPGPTVTLSGVDVASYQGNPNWSQVAASGVSFAITKATEGTDYTNPTFLPNWSGIKSAGLVRGVYHYARPEYGNTAEAEADYFLGRLASAGGLQTGDIVALDLEPTQPVPGLSSWVLAWLRRVEQRAGVKPIVYTGAWVISQQGLGGVTPLAQHALWLAAYQSNPPPAPAPWSTVSIWQYSSEGSVPGIVGDVDMNRFWGTREQLLALGKGGATPPMYYQPGDIGSGILELMRQDGTDGAAPSTFLPLGRSPALIEEAYGLNGTRYSWHIPTGRSWRYRPA